MQNTYRIKTNIGQDNFVNFQLDQNIEFLEILSFKVRQSDIYTLDCANYGVVAGRITANNGFGLANARVSVFIPLSTEDEDNALINSIYPYKSIGDKNEEGYRYNLLPYEPSYEGHVATGNFPSLNDVLAKNQYIEVYEKYYKFTVKTNDSGDYMIFGVPIGGHTVFMDLDLSDIGAFSLTPQDLIRMGRAAEGQFKGNSFQASTDLESLPQIVSLSKGIEVSPFWGDPETCDSTINRVDFDLRTDASIDIQPTSIFIGSIFGTNNIDSVKLNCGVKESLGNLCLLETGPGLIQSIRQTKSIDSDGLPILEFYELDNGGRVIDGDGTWVVEMPMNLDYIITDENGNLQITEDETIGIPTRGKYRFNIKWEDSISLTNTTRKANFLVPNIKEYGWTEGGGNPSSSGSNDEAKKAQSGSYYFGLDWKKYTNKIAAINCEDTFYEFEYNKVYTVSGLVDQYQGGTNKGKFIGIKEIGDRSCEQVINKYPVNDGVKNFDLFYYLFSIILQIIQFINIPLIFGYHLISFLWNFMAVILLPAIIVLLGFFIKNYISNVIKNYAISVALFSAGIIPTLPTFASFLLFQISKDLLLLGPILFLLVYLTINFKKIVKKKLKLIHLPNITYPNCEFCICDMKEVDVDLGSGIQNNGVLSQVSNYTLYYDKLSQNFDWKLMGNIIENNTSDNINYKDSFNYEDDKPLLLFTIAQSIGGRTDNSSGINPKKIGETDIKMPRSDEFQLIQIDKKISIYSETLPIGERINYFNLRENYFYEKNKVKVTFANDIIENRNKFHYDNVIVLLSEAYFDSGDILSFVNNSLSKDPNFLVTGTTIEGEIIYGVNGTTKITNTNNIINVKYANTQDTEGSQTYKLPFITGATSTSYYASDIEYFQVITGITYSDYIKLSDTNTKGYLPSVLTSPAVLRVKIGGQGTPGDELVVDNPIQYFNGIENQYVLILQRGVDPYSPEYDNKYDLSKIFGYEFGNIIINSATKLNIPIQKLNEYAGNIRLLGKGGNSSDFITTQTLTNQEDIFFESYSFQPGIEFRPYESDSVSYYSGIFGRNSPITKPFIIKLGLIPTLIKYIKNWVSAEPIDSDNNFFIVNSERAGREKDYPKKTPIQWIDSKYSNSKLDFNGGTYMVGKGDVVANNKYDINPFEFDNFMLYYSYSSHLELKNRKLSHSNSNKIILRTDRLPTSDGLDGKNWYSNGVGILQQNNSFTIYKYPKKSTGENSPLYINAGFDADILANDLEGLPGYASVNTSFNSCKDLVPLSCSENKNDSETLSITEKCKSTKRQSIYIKDGCYQLVRRPILDLLPDIDAFREWAFRFKLNYGLCRGIVSETFVNNWVNGSLFMPSFKSNTIGAYRNNPQYCKDIVYYDNTTSNFYYRSSPYYSGTTMGQFVGNQNNYIANKLNYYNLMYPTTIINLGIKNKLLIGSRGFDTYGYMVNQINYTSYSDNSDLINMFVMSRVLDSSILKNLNKNTNITINSFFSRNGKKVDGDLAQLMSINSEFGVVKFSSEFYSFTNNNSPSLIFREKGRNYMGVFYSSLQDDLTYKDYISPGRIGFRDSITNSLIPRYFDIRSQEVPFYSWELAENSNSIFGTDKNNWGTQKVDIVAKKYQSLERIKPRNNDTAKFSEYDSTDYFVSDNSDIAYNSHRGYIYSDINGKYNKTKQENTKFVVGAPFHFYFGIKKGFSSLDKFKTKYLNE